MINTFTPNQIITEPLAEKEAEEKISLPDLTEPSDNVVNMILNFSKNLEIKTSEYIKEVKLMKS